MAGGPKSSGRTKGPTRESQGECSLWLFFSLLCRFTDRCGRTLRGMQVCGQGVVARGSRQPITGRPRVLPSPGGCTHHAAETEAGRQECPTDAASRPKTSKLLSTGAIVGCAPSPLPPNTALGSTPFCLPLTSPWWVRLPPRRSNSGWDSELGSLRQMGERMHEHAHPGDKWGRGALASNRFDA